MKEKLTKFLNKSFAVFFIVLCCISWFGGLIVGMGAIGALVHGNMTITLGRPFTKLFSSEAVEKK